MIHPSQLKVSIHRPPEGGQRCGVPLPCVTVEHVSTGNSVTVKDGRSRMECQQVATEALEYALLAMRWHQVDLEMDISITNPRER